MARTCPIRSHLDPKLLSYGHSPNSAHSDDLGQLSPAATDRVFPIRSVVSVDPAQTPSTRSDRGNEGYFQSGTHPRGSDLSYHVTHSGLRQGSTESNASKDDDNGSQSRMGSTSTVDSAKSQRVARQPQQIFADLALSNTGSADSGESVLHVKEPPGSTSAASPAHSVKSSDEPAGGLLTARFKHIISEGGHAIITGRDGDTLQRCEDEPIHIPGAVQGFGLLLALQEQADGRLLVRIVSENSDLIIGYSPKQLFALESFTDILSEEQADNLLDHIDFIRDEDADVTVNGPEVFTISIRSPSRRAQKLWCAMHVNDRNPGLIICEFELEDDPINPLIPINEKTPEPPQDTMNSTPTAEEFAESTQNTSKPLRVLRSARERKGEAAAMEVFNIMAQVQEQLAAAPNLDRFLKVLVGVVKELTGFHRVMVYQFDQAWNGRVVTELVDPRATKDLYKGLNFPASDIPKQARELYKINKVRMLYDRDHETARLVCRTLEDLQTPLDMTFSYLRAMSPIHIKYLANMAVRSSMSISINAFGELWGLIACHSYGSKGMRVSFPIRKMCRLVGHSASRNIERLSYASRLQARKLINTVPTEHKPTGYIIASSEDLLKLFDADFGLLSIRDETKILGNLEQSQEALAMLEYLRMRQITSVMTSQDIRDDFPDLRYPPGFQFIAGLLLVPLSAGGQDFIVFFRRGQLKEVKWAGNPYEKFIKEGTEGYLEPRKSFKTWSETVVGKCREWTEEEVETAAVLCLVYGKFIEVWRQKEAALQNSQLTKLLLANSAHEVQTPLNAIINYLEIALEGSLDSETRENLAKSHSASKSLIYVINDLLDLTKTEEGGELIKGETFDLKDTLKEATEMFRGDAKRKQITYEVTEHPGLPENVIGDQRRVRQAISNVVANAIQNTIQGLVKVEMFLASRVDAHVEIEIVVQDTGVGMSSKKLDALFRDLEQVTSESDTILEGSFQVTSKALTAGEDSEKEPSKDKGKEKRTLGLGLAVVARIVRNMNGQLRLKSEEGKGSRFVIQFPFQLPDSEPSTLAGSATGYRTPRASSPSASPDAEGEVTLVDKGNASVRRSSRDSSLLGLSRKNSADSVNSSRKSLKSMKSGKSQSSAQSGRSDVDRLIEAISEPRIVERGQMQRSASRSSGNRPRIGRNNLSHTGTSRPGSPVAHRANNGEVNPTPEHLRTTTVGPPGQANVADTRAPVKAIRMPDETASPSGPDRPTTASRVLGEIQEASKRSEEPPTADHLHVLVAEDDPVNSRIIKKRLDKIGHEVYLTVNGEECASAYGDKSGFFDVVLMDMQASDDTPFPMPIVDGLTSAKMIRSFEKSHPSHLLSTRASLNSRVPIIAVSASLIERERQVYIDAGFDGWILKPISFPRLSELLTGIVDANVRRKNRYQPGVWEKGGWFQEVQKDVFAADTKPSMKPPMTAPSEGVKIAAASDDPFVREEQDSRQTEEQRRLEGRAPNLPKPPKTP
ncbi:hypothetical protein B0A49_03687 [Cryomyces minteri]|uniref:Cyanobacterial phytochrome B n=1 Tax=Cryomyces minteri TaxID=331657 RepID=A0A4U0XPC9_9PEZI|nr:hypothetical protein B0A49_03687 [Cryomyces minteri]